MTDLTNFQVGQVYPDMITLNPVQPGTGLTDVLVSVGDGLGNTSPMQMSSLAVNFIVGVGSTFQLNGTPLIATAANLNLVTGPTPFFGFSRTALTLPFGATAERPTSLVAGQIRWNTTTSEWEGYDGAAWRTFDVT
jgi:hypothetical protein